MPASPRQLQPHPLPSWLVLLPMLLLAGCDRTPYEGSALPNAAPETEITATPPSLSNTDIQVHFHWNGDDPDGEIAGFEWRISDNGSDGIIDVADTLEAALPWRFTTAFDSLFEVSAELDSLPTDIGDPTLTRSNIRNWQTHTFFVRAVDDDGLRDPTPAQSSFTATTLTPLVRVDHPRNKTTTSCASTAAVLSFGWKPVDPDGGRHPRLETRYLLKQHQGTHCVSLAEYELNPPVSARDSGWSPWLLYDPDDPGSYTKTFERASLGQMFFFAVQARDAAGAITADMIWNENVRHMRVSGDKIPVLNFSDSQLGDFRFVGTRGLRSVEIIGGFPITASWSGDASAYAGTIEAYRWGWDVLDPESTFDPGWAVQWGDTPAHRTVGSKTFDEGILRLTIACRDNSGSVSRATILINIIPIPDREFRRQLLIVEDIPILEQSAHLGLERRWQADLLRLAGGTLRYFGPEDWIDADAEPERVTFRELIKFQTILWMAGSNGRTFYYEQFGFAGASPVHWLEVYQQRVGNLLFVGSAAASAATRGSFTGGSLPLVYSGRGRSWAYENFCLATSDLVRPPLGVPEGELPTRPLRSLQCDGIVEATLADEFAVRYPESRILLSTLLPTEERLALDRPWWFQLDEFYNHNATFANIAFVARDCQLPFLRLRTRRATGVLEIPEDECVPPNTSRSLVEGAAIAIASTANSQTKPLQGSEDFLLGFNPFSYREEGVRRLFRYIFVNHWGLETF